MFHEKIDNAIVGASVLDIVRVERDLEFGFIEVVSGLYIL